MRLGKYTLLQKIATGGMAEIFLARQDGPAGFQKILVIKRILPHFAHDERFVTMFLNEARLAALLNHPNVVSIFDLGEEDGSYYLAMEHIHGRSLDQILDRCQALGRRVPLALCARIVADAAQGLHYAHGFAAPDGTPLNLVHRDVSPQNVLVTFDGLVKLVDFGVAKAATNTGKTQTGAVKGKYAYMSPEQIAGQPLDRRSDIFALGVVLYELATGRRPFGQQSDLLAITAILNEAPVPAREIVPDFPGSLETVMLRCLDKDRDRRYPDAEEIHRDLERFIRSEGTFVGARELAQFLTEIFGEEIASGNPALLAAQLPALDDEDATAAGDSEGRTHMGQARPEAEDPEHEAGAATVILGGPAAATASAPATPEPSPAPQSEPSLPSVTPLEEPAAPPPTVRVPELRRKAAGPAAGATPPREAAAAAPASKPESSSGGGGALIIILLIVLLVLGGLGAGGYLLYAQLGGGAPEPKPPVAGPTTPDVKVPASGAGATTGPVGPSGVQEPTPPGPGPAQVAAPDLGPAAGRGADAGTAAAPLPPEVAPPRDPKPPVRPAGKGTVCIQAPSGATVTIDSKVVGKMPLRCQTLSAGRHRVAATWPEDEAKDPVQRSVTVERNGVYNVSLF